MTGNSSTVTSSFPIDFCVCSVLLSYALRKKQQLLLILSAFANIEQCACFQRSCGEIWEGGWFQWIGEDGWRISPFCCENSLPWCITFLLLISPCVEFWVNPPFRVFASILKITPGVLVSCLGSINCFCLAGWETNGFVTHNLSAFMKLFHFYSLKNRSHCFFAISAFVSVWGSFWYLREVIQMCVNVSIFMDTYCCHNFFM